MTLLQFACHPLATVIACGEQESDGFVFLYLQLSGTVLGAGKVQCMLAE